MIEIKQQEGKWRIKITNEEWEFQTFEESRKEITKLLDMKNKHGQINKKEEYDIYEDDDKNGTI